MNQHRIIRLLVSVFIGIIAAGSIAYVQTRNAGQVEAGNGYIGQPFGGDFAGLMDQDGRVLERDAFAGKSQIVFFGFTHCPAICPAALQKMTHVLKGLDPAQREKLATVFITVDPARDTPDTLKSYLSAFGPGITALTGRQERINEILADWKAYAGKVPLEDGGYTMDHSAFLYLRDAGGNLVGLYPSEEAPDALLAAIKAKLGG